MSKKYQMVNISNDDNGELLLIESTEVEKVINFYDERSTCKVKDSLSDEGLQKLNDFYSIKKANDELSYHETYEIVNEFFEENDIDDTATNIQDAEEYTNQDILYIHDGKFEQGNLIDYDFCYSYEYWDGSNHKRLWLEDIDEDLSFDENEIEWISLDQWNGRNFVFNNSQCSHAEAGKWKENTWLIKEWCQFQGTHTTIKILEGKDELENWFDENNIKEIPEELK